MTHTETNISLSICEYLFSTEFNILLEKAITLFGDCAKIVSITFAPASTISSVSFCLS